MIEFRLQSGETLDMYPDTVLSLEVGNPLYDTEVIKGVIVYPFDFPETPGNRKKLGFPSELLNKISTGGSYKVTIYFDGDLFKAGTLTITKVVDGRITATFVAGVGALNISLPKNLKDVNYGSPVPFSYNSFNIIATGIPGGGIIGLAIDFTYNGVTTTFHHAGTIVVSDNATYKLAVEELVALFMADTSGMATNHVVEVKSYYNGLVTQKNKIFFHLADGVSAVLNTGHADYLGTWSASFSMEHIAAGMKTTASLSYPAVNYNFPIIKAPDFYGAVSSYPGYVNFYAPDIQEYVMNQKTAGLRAGLVAVPMPYFVYVFKKVFESTGYKIKGAFLDDPDVKKLIIFNTQTLDAVVYDASNPNTIVINKWSDFIDIKNHVPDISVADFFKGVKNFFNLGIFVDDSKHGIEFVLLEEVIADPETEDWTPYTSRVGKEIDFNSGHGYTLKLANNLNSDVTARAMPLAGTVKASVATTADLATVTGSANGDLRLVRDIDQYYQCSQLYNGTVYTFQWTYFSENYYDYKVGDGANEIPISIGTLLMTNEVEYARVPRWLLPTYAGSGTSSYFDVGINKAPFTLLNYQGMQNDSAGQPYPMASNGYKNYAGSTVGSLSLKPDESLFGIYAKYYKNWINFLNRSRPVVRTCDLPLSVLKNPNLRKKKRIENVNLIVSKITVNLTMKGIKPATVYFNKV